MHKYIKIILTILIISSCKYSKNQEYTHELITNNKEQEQPKDTKPVIIDASQPIVPVIPPAVIIPTYPGLAGGGGSNKRDKQITNNEDQLKTSWLLRWSNLAINTTGIDHSPAALIALFGFSPQYLAQEPSDEMHTQVIGYGEQLGPARSSRAMAIIHIAIFEAINAIEQEYESYTNLAPFLGSASIQAAIAQAAHDTLLALYPLQSPTFADALAEALAQIPDDLEKTNGIFVGAQAALSILNMRNNDGSDHDEAIIGIDFFPSNDIGKWRPDPISNGHVALGANWHTVTPFVIQSASQFRIPSPPALNSSEYTKAYKEVKEVGGDGIITPTIRTPEQEEIGIFWAYDGTPSLCAPPRLYNQIASSIALQRNTEFIEFARLLALVNVAMADAAIAIWESKYFYQIARPVTGIREADLDGNPDTIVDHSFTPLGAPASNLNGANFTPPFPAYPSGHAGFGGALFQTLRNFYETDNIHFSFVSDEFNGSTKDNQGNIRPIRQRSFSTLSQAEEENAQSRMYLGIHWEFDKTTGIKQGRNVADYIFEHIFKPLQ